MSMKHSQRWIIYWFVRNYLKCQIKFCELIIKLETKRSSYKEINIPVHTVLNYSWLKEKKIQIWRAEFQDNLSSRLKIPLFRTNETKQN